MQLQVDWRKQNGKCYVIFSFAVRYASHFSKNWCCTAFFSQWPVISFLQVPSKTSRELSSFPWEIKWALLHGNGVLCHSCRKLFLVLEQEGRDRKFTTNFHVANVNDTHVLGKREIVSLTIISYIYRRKTGNCISKTGFCGPKV